jgi:PAS domain S-box-containing protein
MNSKNVSASFQEVQMKDSDFFVSKTNLKSHISYVNRGFCQMSGYQESELLGQTYDLVRHELVPHSIYNLMWEHLNAEEEFFGYIVNLNKNDSYYWAFLNVTPCYENNQLIGYFSVQREPSQQALQAIKPLYTEMCQVERQATAAQLLPLSSAVLWRVITKEYQNYAEFVLSL